MHSFFLLFHPIFIVSVWDDGTTPSAIFPSFSRSITPRNFSTLCFTPLERRNWNFLYPCKLLARPLARPHAHPHTSTTFCPRAARRPRARAAGGTCPSATSTSRSGCVFQPRGPLGTEGILPLPREGVAGGGSSSAASWEPPRGFFCSAHRVFFLVCRSWTPSPS